MKKIFTYTVLALFLVVRYSDNYLFNGISNDKTHASIKSVFIFSIYGLILLTTWINKNNLNEFNIDRSFFFILLGDSVLLTWSYFPWMLGIFMLVAVGVLLFEYRKKTYRFSELTITSPNIIGLMIFVIILPVLFSKYKSGAHITYEQIRSSLLYANLFGVIFEEFLFRGLLWVF